MGQVYREGPASEVNGDVGGLIHKAEIQLRRLQPEASSQSEGVSNLSSIIQRISRTSVSELEQLIAELQMMRDYLLSEGQRVQREITEYAHMNQAAIKSAKIVTESLAQWKAGPDRGPRG
jgi:hypothetical protein